MQLSARQPDGKTLRQHLLAAQRASGITHPLLIDEQLPPGADDLFALTIELSESRPQGMGPAGGIPPSEIVAWQQLHNVRLSPWHITTMRDIDRAMRAEAGRQAEAARERRKKASNDE